MRCAGATGRNRIRDEPLYNSRVDTTTSPIPQPYLVFLGDAESHVHAKTAHGLVDWRREVCVGQFRFPSCAVDLGLPEMQPEEAVAAGARTLVIGVAPFGGSLSPNWVDAIVTALNAGLNVASGLHTRLGDVEAIAAAAGRTGMKLFDVRHSHRVFPIASGRKRIGRRLLTVGTDCSVGKKYTALTIWRELRKRSMPATFRATGQTGILISGEGVAVDAVVADFIAGASETLSPDNTPEHWDIVEGQGSLFHPAYAGVSLGLLHGSQPDALVLCHAAGRDRIVGCAGYPVPSLRDAIEFNQQMARLTNPAARCVGVSINTSGRTDKERTALLRGLEEQLEMPCFDPVADGVSALVDQLQAFPTSR